MCSSSCRIQGKRGTVLSKSWIQINPKKANIFQLSNGPAFAYARFWVSLSLVKQNRSGKYRNLCTQDHDLMWARESAELARAPNPLLPLLCWLFQAAQKHFWKCLLLTSNWPHSGQEGLLQLQGCGEIQLCCFVHSFLSLTNPSRVCTGGSTGERGQDRPFKGHRLGFLTWCFLNLH